MTSAARIAFCNDTDFAAWATYREVQHVLANEYGFPAEDSFWLFDPSGSDLALFRGSVKEKGPKHDELLEDIRGGKLTVLHSAGNFSRTNTSQRPRRGDVAEALAYLAEHARVPRVWTNHGDEGDVQNVGGIQPSYHEGDDPGSSAFILDLLLQYGVRWFWTDHHATNDFALPAEKLVVTERTRSGHDIRCFYRYRGALKKAPDAQSFEWQLREENLDALVRAGGVCVVYQHWSVHRDETGRAFTARGPVLPQGTRAALKRLADARERRGVQVMRVSELLEACDAERAA